MSDARHWLACSLGFGLVLGIAGSCVLEDPNHCVSGNFGCGDGEVCDPCTPSTMNHGCVAMGEDLDGLPNAEGCQTPPYPTTESSTVGPDSSSSGVTDPTMSAETVDTTETPETSDPSTTTGDPPTCNESNGTYGGTCEGAAPFCMGGECVPCSTDEPLTTCPDDLVCDSSGACVVCNDQNFEACGGETPYCDPQSNVCVPCTEHEHCGTSACNLFTGACVSGDVITVGDGQEQPNLISAVTALGAAGGTLIIQDDIYNETVTVGGGAIVAFLASSGASPVWQRTTGAGAPQLRVTAASTVLIDGIELRSNASAVDPALRVDGASLWVDRSVIAQNLGVAVSAENGATLRVRNSFLGGVADLAVLNAELNSNVQIRYSTLGASLGDATAVLCDGGSMVTASDSIILSRGNGPAVVCPMFMANRSAGSGMLPGTDNEDVGAVVTTWFTNYNGGDFHLSASGGTAFSEVARWDDGDPLVDIDGDPRSGADGMAEPAGADLP